MNGKKVAWLGVVLLPFIDSELLLAAIREAESTLSEEERDRNTLKEAIMFIQKNHTISFQVVN